MDCAGLIDAYLMGMIEGTSFDAAMERRFQDYLEDLGAVVGNDARRRGLSDYMTGLLLPGERKSMEPIAERLESGNVSRCSGARRQENGVLPWFLDLQAARTDSGRARSSILLRTLTAMRVSTSWAGRVCERKVSPMMRLYRLIAPSAPALAL